MRRFFAAPESFRGDEVILNPDESRHLRDVLRLRAGEAVRVFDGAGNEFVCSIETFERRSENLRLIRHEKVDAPAPESPLNLTVAVALLKNEKFDLVVQKTVELGAKKIVPLMTKRADVRFEGERDADKKIERWRRVALEAAKQSGRAVVPQISAPIAFNDFVSERNANDTKILFVERGGDKLKHNLPADVLNLTAVVGSEGGWEISEIETARRNSVRIVTLDGRILRAETAAIAVTTLLQHLVGDLN